MSILDRFRLGGRRALVTGASRGLGREMALALADAGADVVLVARPSHDLDATADDIRALGRTAWALEADVGDAGDRRGGLREGPAPRSAASTSSSTMSAGGARTSPSRTSQLDRLGAS